MKKISVFTIIIMIFAVTSLIPQYNSNEQNSFDSKIDEINAKYTDKQKIDALNAVIKSEITFHTRHCLDIATSILKSASEMNYTKGKAEALYNLGKCYYLTNYYKESDSLFNEAVKYFSEIKDNENLVRAMIDRANSNKEMNNAGIAFQILKSTDSITNINVKFLKPIVQQETGNLYAFTGNIPKAVENLKNSLNYYVQENNKTMQSFVKMDIGKAYLKSDNPSDAILYFQEARNTLDKTNDKILIAQTFKYEADVYKTIGNYEEAFQIYNKALDIFSVQNDNEGLKNTYYELYQIESIRNNQEAAFKYLEKYSELLQQELNYNFLKKESEKKIGYESVRKMIAQNKIYEQDKELKNIKNQNEIQKLENEKQSSWITFITILTALMIAIAIILYLLFSNKKKQSEVLTEINNELNTKNSLIDSQKTELEFKNKSILDSINYAVRIQKAILPIQSMGKSLFKDFFVLFLPKDIISGDFYWFAINGDYRFAAVIDCTGHGVPGALMSVIGNTMLNEIISGEQKFEPKDILTTLNEKIRFALKQDYEVGANDGMDMALIRFNSKTKELIFAGAKRPLYLIENSELKVFNGDKFSIGGSLIQNNSEFTQQEIIFSKTAYIYLTTDGFADQNNPENKKFGTKNLKNLLIEINKNKFEEQMQILNQKFQEFKQSEPNRDDVTILGIKVSK